MSEQYIENILIRRISTYETEPQPIVKVSDLGGNYEFRGIIQLKRIRTTENNCDAEDAFSGYEYVFDVQSVSKFQKQ